MKAFGHANHWYRLVAAPWQWQKFARLDSSLSRKNFQYTFPLSMLLVRCRSSRPVELCERCPVVGAHPPTFAVPSSLLVCLSSAGHFEENKAASLDLSHPHPLFAQQNLLFTSDTTLSLVVVARPPSARTLSSDSTVGELEMGRPTPTPTFSLPPTPPFSPTTHAYHALERVLSLDLDATQGWDQYEVGSDDDDQDDEMLPQHQQHAHGQAHTTPRPATKEKESELDRSWREKGTGGTGKLRVVIVTGE